MGFFRASFLFAIFGVGGAVSAYATPVNPSMLFKRCYHHLVGEQPTYEMTTRFSSKVAAASSTEDGQRDYAIGLCVELLNGLNIETSGKFSSPHTSAFFTSDEQTAIYPHLYLNFQRLHLSWFGKSHYQPSDDQSLARYTVEPNEPALYWNAALFTPGLKASSVVTSDAYYRPLKTNSPLPTPTPGQSPGPCVFSASNDFLTNNINYIKCTINTRNGITSVNTTSPRVAFQHEAGGIFTFDSNLNLIFTGSSAYESDRAKLVARFGVTVGLESVSASLPYATYPTFVNAHSSNVTSVTLTKTTALSTVAGGRLVTGYNAKTVGGGLLGSPDYVMMNMTDYPDAADGGLKVARDWSYDVMGDLLCKALPALTFSDGNSNVQKTITANTPPFRQGASCMACHANLDNLAYAVRNIHIGVTNTVADARVSPTIILTANHDANTAVTPNVVKWPTVLPAVDGFTDGMTNFQNTPPTGKLYFRSYDNSLVNIGIANGVADVGAAISQTKDFYACAVSRYFQYFTGRPVDLNASNVSLKEFSDNELAERNWVIAQGEALKNDKTQNLKTVLTSMMQSAWYRDQGYGGVK